MYENYVVISRHQAAIEFVARQLGGVYNDGKGGDIGPCVVISRWFDNDSGCWSYSNNGGIREDEFIPVITGNASPDDVRGKVVYGNVPLSLAAMADSVVVIEFDGAPPRGAEYGLEEMDKAGARLSRYSVVRQM